MLLAGCVAPTLLTIVGFALAGLWLFHSVQQAAANCLPSDFPRYPGATQGAYYYSLNGPDVTPGDTRHCTMTLDSNDDVATVTAFYADRLSSAPWTLDSGDPATGELRFHRASRPKTVGKVDLVGRGGHTEIDVVLDS